MSVVASGRRAPPTLRPLLADPATLEVVVVADHPLDLDAERTRSLVVAAGRTRQREAGADAARGEVILFVDDETLASRGLASGHARHHAGGRRLVAVGFTPVRLVAERVGDDFATRMYAHRYERRCEAYERDPTRVLTELPGRNFSLRRDEFLALGEGDDRMSDADAELGLRCLDAGLAPVFDRSLQALHLYSRSPPEFARDAGRTTAQARVLRAIVAAAGSAQAWNLQDAAARRLWRIETRSRPRPRRTL